MLREGLSSVPPGTAWRARWTRLLEELAGAIRPGLRARFRAAGSEPLAQVPPERPAAESALPRALPLALKRLAPSMPEVPHAGEDHRQAVLVAGGDDLVVLHRAAGLDDRGHAGCAAASTLSRNGKNASDASTRALQRGRAPSSTAIRTESTRLICPAPTPDHAACRCAQHDRVGLDVLAHASTRSSGALHSSSVGLRFVTTSQLASDRPVAASRSCTSSPPSTRR